jgi:hypothetical protein
LSAVSLARDISWINDDSNCKLLAQSATLSRNWDA